MHSPDDRPHAKAAIDGLCETSLKITGAAAPPAAVDPEETDGPCRHAARWRLDGRPLIATLVFWRETRDCDGRAGWRVPVGP